VETTNIPPSGVYSLIDNAPPSRAAFYRVAWVP
jgi:hypothetical protein